MKLLKFAALCIAFAILFCSCMPKMNSVGFVSMDTYVNIKAQCDENLLEKAKQQVIDMSAMLDCHADSPLTELNDTQTLQVDGTLADIISRSLEYAKMTGGAFNPAMFSITDLWKVGESMSAVPPEKEIKKALKMCDYKKIKVDGNNVSLGGTKLDLGAVAKGYVSQKTVEMMKSEGVKNAVISLGGNIALIGDKDGGGWTVAIQNPRGKSDEQLGMLTASDCYVVTSGDYQRYKMLDGKRYHHIFSANGYPADSGLISVIAVCKDGTAADVYSTALFVMGKNKALDFIAKTDGLDAVLVTSDKKVIVTDGIKENFKLTSKDYSYED